MYLQIQNTHVRHILFLTTDIQEKYFLCKYMKLFIVVLMCLASLQELSKQTEAMAVQAENLVKNSSEIQLGSKNKQSLQQQAKSIQEQVKKVEVTLEEEYVLNKF